MIGEAYVRDSVTTNAMGDVPASPSVTEPPSTDSVGAVSSLAMTPVATAWPRVAPEGFDRVTITVSSGSTTVSPRIPTVTVCEVCPAAKVSVPEAAV